MHHITLLEPAIAPTYAPLTYPLFRPHLHTLETSKTWMAVGAHAASGAIGLAIAEIQSNGQAVIQSLYVQPAHRNQGIATALLTTVEQVLRQRGCHELQLSYVTGKSTTGHLEKLLQRQGWATPHPHIRTYRSTLASMQRSPWWYEYRLPSKFTVFPLADMTRADYEEIQQQQTIASWYTSDLDLFKADTPIEPFNSIGVRYHGQVVGWMATHRVTPDTIRYSSLVLRPDLQKMGRAIALVGEAIRRQLQAGSPNNFLCSVRWSNPAMLRFAERRLAPLATLIQDSKTTWKLL